MVRGQKQINGATEWNREPRNKPTHLQSVNLQKMRQRYTMEKNQSLQHARSGKLDNHM